MTLLSKWKRALTALFPSRRRKSEPPPLPAPPQNWVCMVCQQTGPDHHTEISPSHRIGLCTSCRDTEDGLNLIRDNQALERKLSQIYTDHSASQPPSDDAKGETAISNEETR